MAEKKGDYDTIAYTLGLVSIVLAFFTPAAGIVLGIVGLVQSKKQSSEIAKKAKKLSKIGIVLGIIVLVISIVVTIYFTAQGAGAGIPGYS